METGKISIYDFSAAQNAIAESYPGVVSRTLLTLEHPYTPAEPFYSQDVFTHFFAFLYEFI